MSLCHLLPAFWMQRQMCNIFDQWICCQCQNMLWTNSQTLHRCNSIWSKLQGQKYLNAKITDAWRNTLKLCFPVHVISFSICLLHSWGIQKLTYCKIIITFICFSITGRYILFLMLGQNPVFLVRMWIIKVTMYSSKRGASYFSYIWHTITDSITRGVLSLQWNVTCVTTFFKWLFLFQWEINIWQCPFVPFN